MALPLRMPFPPMEALSVDDIPTGRGWLYEPKWDGFRCLIFRDGDRVALQSKAGRPLTRYFPDVLALIRRALSKRFVLDGEIVVPVGSRLSFDDLLMRIHPAESRVRKLAELTPASFIAFDLLVNSRGQSLLDLPLEKRKHQLEMLARSMGGKSSRVPTILLSPSTTDRRVAQRWLRSAGGALDGIIAKRLDQPYVSGERAMLKIKPIRTADCVIGGFRYATAGKIVASLLLGLYDENGLLNHVGFTSSMGLAERKRLTPKLEALVKQPGFTGQAPGGPSRWSTKRSTEWEPLAPKLVVEVQYDHFSGARFRHGTKFKRWRPDKSPTQCTYDQLSGTGPSLQKLLSGRS